MTALEKDIRNEVKESHAEEVEELKEKLRDAETELKDKVRETEEELKEKLIDVPEVVDREVAVKKLAFLGKQIDVLTPEQERYLNSSSL